MTNGELRSITTWVFFFLTVLLSKYLKNILSDVETSQSNSLCFTTILFGWHLCNLCVLYSMGCLGQDTSIEEILNLSEVLLLVK